MKKSSYWYYIILIILLLFSSDGYPQYINNIYEQILTIPVPGNYYITPCNWNIREVRCLDFNYIDNTDGIDIAWGQNIYYTSGGQSHLLMYGGWRSNNGGGKFPTLADPFLNSDGTNPDCFYPYTQVKDIEFGHLIGNATNLREIGLARYGDIQTFKYENNSLVRLQQLGGQSNLIPTNSIAFGSINNLHPVHDLVAAVESNTNPLEGIQVYFNDGQGILGDNGSPNIRITGIQAKVVRTAFFQPNQQYLDIVATVRTDNAGPYDKISIYKNNGNGGLIQTLNLFDPGVGNIRDINVGFINNDGSSDLVVTGGLNNGTVVKVFLGDQNGSINTAPVVTFNSTELDGANFIPKFGDMGGDTKQDLVLCGQRLTSCFCEIKTWILINSGVDPYFSTNRGQQVTDNLITVYGEFIEPTDMVLADIQEIGRPSVIYSIGYEYPLSDSVGKIIVHRHVVPPPRPWACPWIFPFNDTYGAYTADNNLLERSEFTENSGQDITDLYKLNVTPSPLDNQLLFMVSETENNYNYFDRVKLYAVDHAEGTKIGVDENNLICIYSPLNILGADTVNQTGEPGNMAPYVRYDTLGNKFIFGHSNDTVRATSFDYGGGNSGDSLAVLMRAGETSDAPANRNPKTPAGVIYVYANSSPIPNLRSFARRENKADIIIPFASVNSSVDSVIIEWQRSYELDYLTIAKVSYSGFNIFDAPLLEATNSVSGNVLSQLTNIDYNYAEFDSTSVLYLKFQDIAPPPQGTGRDYVFETDGRYVSSGSMNPLGNQLHNTITNNAPHKFVLYQNYPNPFNPVTNIIFDLPMVSNVKITVYDITGKQVSVLLDERKDVGTYSVAFDGTNLASGIYFYRIEAGDFIDTKKMVLVK